MKSSRNTPPRQVPVIELLRHHRFHGQTYATRPLRPSGFKTIDPEREIPSLLYALTIQVGRLFSEPSSVTSRLQQVQEAHQQSACGEIRCRSDRRDAWLPGGGFQFASGCLKAELRGA